MTKALAGPPAEDTEAGEETRTSVGAAATLGGARDEHVVRTANSGAQHRSSTWHTSLQNEPDRCV